MDVASPTFVLFALSAALLFHAAAYPKLILTAAVLLADCGMAALARQRRNGSAFTAGTTRAASEPGSAR